MSAPRHPEWERRLVDYLVSVRLEPHVYGKHDCMLHPAQAVAVVTGVDHGKKHRGKYRSLAGAVRHLSSLGFDSPAAMLDSMFEEVPVGFAQRGDLVLTPANDESAWPVPGVCFGAFAFCVSDGGLIREPRARWLKAWKVGR